MQAPVRLLHHKRNAVSGLRFTVKYRPPRRCDENRRLQLRGPGGAWIPGRLEIKRKKRKIHSRIPVKQFLQKRGKQEFILRPDLV